MLCDIFMHSFTLVLIVWDRIFRVNQFCRRAVGDMNIHLGQINGFLAPVLKLSL